MTGCLIVCIERATRLVKSQQSAGKSEWEEGWGNLKLGRLSVFPCPSACDFSEVISYIGKILQTNKKNRSKGYFGLVCAFCFLPDPDEAALLGVLGAFDKHVEPSGSAFSPEAELSPSLTAGLSLQAPRNTLQLLPKIMLPCHQGKFYLALQGALQADCPQVFLSFSAC